MTKAGRTTYQDLCDFAKDLSREFNMAATPITVEQAHYGIGYWIIVPPDIVPGATGPARLRWCRRPKETLEALRSMRDGMLLGEVFGRPGLNRRSANV